MRIADFERDLRWSKGHTDAPWWELVYREAFPDLLTMATINEDGLAQRAGIDRVLTLTDGTSLRVDEKVREDDWPDVLLELWGDRERSTKGWAHPDKELYCEYIAYALLPSGTCYLLPVRMLRRALRQHREEWHANAERERWGYRYVNVWNPGRNGRAGWTTVSIVVPTGDLLDAIRDALVIRWKEGNATTT